MKSNNRWQPQSAKESGRDLTVSWGELSALGKTPQRVSDLKPAA